MLFAFHRLRQGTGYGDISHFNITTGITDVAAQTRPGTACGKMG